MGDLKIESLDIDQVKDQIGHNKAANKHDLWLTLDEVNKGCIKTTKIQRKILDEQNEILEEKEFTIVLEPGVQTGKEILILKEGDQQLDGNFSDGVFVVCDIENVTFKREGQNIRYIAKISHNQLKNKETILIPTLENKAIKFQLTNEIVSTMEKRLYGRGLPFPSEPQYHGCLIVQFKLVKEKDIESEEFQILNEVILVEESVKIPDDDVENNLEEPPVETILPYSQYNHYLLLTLDEIYNGCIKTVKILRKLIDKDGDQETENELFSLDVPIKPGSIEGTQISVKLEDVRVEVVFTVYEQNHSVFTREGLDIIYTAKIEFDKAQQGCKIQIPTLNSYLIERFVNGGITNETVEKIVNYGIPSLDDETRRGDLVLKFNIIKDIPKGLPVVNFLELSLEEIFYGKVVQTKIQKLITEDYGKIEIIEKSLTIQVPPGIQAGTKFIFPQEGDKNPGSIPADIVFEICEMKHGIFTRNGADIVYVASVTPSQLSREDKFEIPLLENKSETISLFLEKSCNQNTVKRIENCGLPYQNNPNKRGDLVIRFEIIKEIKDADILYDLPLSLKNILTGYTKFVNINRKKLIQNGKEIFEDVEIEIDVKPGTAAGTRYRFKNLGNEYPGIIPADIVFIACDKPHVHFQRSGLDIVHYQLITENEAKKSVKIETPTLEKDKYLKHEIKKFNPKILKGFVKNYHGYGLPKFNNPSKRGDLHVHYEIVANENKVENLEINVEVSLEEVLLGANKSVEFTTTSTSLSGEIIKENKVETMSIKPGVQYGFKFISRRRGNKEPGCAPGDVWFICVEKPHPNFKRDGVDLIYTTKITTKQAKLHFIDIPTLDKLTVTKKFENVTSDTVINIPRMGLPYCNEPTKRGNLFVKFEISDDELSKTENLPNSTIDVNFFVPLQNILNGSIETVIVPIRKFNIDGSSTNEFKEFLIKIKPGTKTGERFVFAQQGNQYPGKTPSDIVFILQDLPHEVFKRNGENIEYTQQIESKKKLLNTSLQIPTLENEIINVNINKENVDNLTIPGYGMPLPDDPTQRGVLVVRFEEL